MEKQYTYAVARIRSIETELLNRQDLEQLLSCKTYDEAMHTLYDKGFGGGETFTSLEELLKYERGKTWKLIGELADDMSAFDVFLYTNDYHNLKAAVKAVLTNAPLDGLFIENATVAPDAVVNAVKERDYSGLPEYMRADAEYAASLLIKTRDGQQCDIFLDRQALSAVLSAGEKSGNAMISKYAELYVAMADIKIAVRACKTGKPLDFIKRALAPCKTLDTGALAAAAAKSIEELYGYLSFTDYAEAADRIKQSMSEFEKWCDNVIMEHIKSQKSNPFTIAPLAAYILARENEIKALRIILSAKRSGLSDDSVRERLRDLYV